MLGFYLFGGGGPFFDFLIKPFVRLDLKTFAEKMVAISRQFNHSVVVEGMKTMVDGCVSA